MATRNVTNLERFFASQYKAAHDLLEDDVDGAERIFLSLLDQPRLPLWTRTQCNFVLARISNEVEAAASFLSDARHVLGLFKDGQPQPDPLHAKIVDMEEHFETTAQEIAHRRDNPWTDDEDDDEEDEHAVSNNVVDELAAPEQVNDLAASEHDDEMLLGYHEDEEKGVDQQLSASEEDDEMLLGHHGDPYEGQLTAGVDEMLLGEQSTTGASPKRTPSPSADAMEVDTEYTPATVRSADSELHSEAESESTVQAESSDEESKQESR